MRKRTSDYYSSDTDQMVSTEDIRTKTPVVDDYQDIFVMRPQTHSNYGDSFKEAKRLYDNGNEEVRKLLLRECSLIYECRKCRNMFRSLTQFIGHKRVFCRSKVHSDDDNAEGDNYNGFSSNHVMATKEICNKKNSKCDSVSQKIDEAGQQTRKLSESDELSDEKIMAGERTEQLFNHTGNGKMKNIIACPQEQCKLSFTNTKELEIHFSQDHTKTTLLTPPAEQVIPEPTVITKAKRVQSTTCHKCEHCGKFFELKEALSTHLLHCPIKHNILSKTLSASLSDQNVTKRIKLQTSTDGRTTELHPSAEVSNENTEKIMKKAPTLAVITATVDLEQAVVVKQEYVSQENGVSTNTNIAGKKRKLKNRRVLTSNTCTNAVTTSNIEEVTHVKQEVSRAVTGTHARVKSECGASSDGSDMEPKKLISTCTYCDKSFERRAALSTHLQHCSVKQSVLEHTSVYGINVCTKRSRLHSTSEKSSKEARQQITTASVEDPDTELLNEMFANLGRQDFGVGLRTVTIDQDDLSASGTDDYKEDEEGVQRVNTPTTLVENPLAHVSLAGDKGTLDTSSNENTPESKEEDMETKASRRTRNAPVEKRLLCRCKICYKQFNALSNLRRHISMFHYRAQRFGCTLCEYRAFRRYDIVNHLCNTHGMNGDPEAMSIEFVSEHEVNYSREDVEGDIVVLDEVGNISALKGSTEDVENGNEPIANTKRLKRVKIIATTSGTSVITSKVARQKLKRSQSQHESSTGGVIKTPARRPIRNRIKPENKDFVYDLSSLVKKDNNTVQSDVTRTLRRRNTANASSAEAATSCIESLLGPADSREQIRGAARRLATTVISSGAAASSTQPELPAQRPQMRPRAMPTHRADNHSVQVIETSDLEAARLQSTLLEDTFLEKVAKASPTSFKIKPSLSLHTSTLSWLLEKVDSSLHQNANGKSSPSNTLCSDDNGIKSIHVSPPPSIPRANAPPPTPRKRITVIDRVRDETFKHRDSLLRSALEN